MLTLRPYQKAAISSIYGYFQTNTGNPLVVIPTAGGKSLVMAAFIEGVLKAWPDQRILIVTHVRELIAQNHAEMIGLWPDAPAGIYSAGLGKREAQARILFAGIQSIHRRAREIGHTDLVLIDEAHLIPGKSSTMYRRFLDALKAINPALKVIGLTATPFRLDSGMLHEGKNALFTDIAYEAPVRDLIDQGYLSPLVSKQPATRLDVSKLAPAPATSLPAIWRRRSTKRRPPERQSAEIIEYGKDRKSWLAFCSGVDHARHVAEEFQRRGYHLPHDLRRHAEGRARCHHRRVQAGRNPRVGVDGRADYRLQRPSRRSHCAPASDAVGRALCPDGRSRHAPGSGQGELPRSGFCWQCAAPRPD
jgi:DNA repair protein RadD